MNINLVSLAAVLLLVFSNGASAQKKPVEKALQRGLPLIVLPPSLAPFSAPIDCNATGTGCAVSIVILEGPINGVDACVANLPSEVRVHGTSSTAAERLMVWTLKLPVGTTATYKFQPKHGILVVDDPKGQLKQGAIGDGLGGTDPTQYHWVNRRRQRGEATYLPIILREVGGVVSLCGAADPKVVND